MTVRVLLLMQWFDPEPTFKGIVFARELVRQGFEVEVVTGFPNYPGGKVYPGYRIKWLQREVIDGVQVTRLPLYPDHGQSAIKRVLNYASFAASAFTYGLFFAKRPAVMYAYHPPLTVGVAAGLIRLLRRIPVVYDIQDMWPDTLRATGMLNNERALGIVGAVCGWVYRRVDHIAVLSPGFKRLLVQRGVPEAKVDVIYNWADEASLTAPRGQLPAAFPLADRFRILFAGNMGKAQALDAVLDAAVLLQKRASRVCFVLLGGGVEVDRLAQRAAELRLGNVLFLPAVPMVEVGTLLQAADALLVHLCKDPLFEITIPSKTQAYMAAGKPLLMAVDGDAADLVRESGGGVIAASEDPQVLAASAEALAAMAPEDLAEMGAKARRHYNEHLSLRSGVERFGALFKRLGAKRTFGVKRAFDVLLAALALLLFAVPFAVLTWQVSRKLGKPVFFRQDRPGLGGRPFEMVKFRTMTDARDINGQLLPDAERLTPFGRFLRSSSLDELPELWNVLKGEMSLVGPRPLLMEYLPLYSAEQARRHEVRPGITGWAQVNGRNALSWEEKFKLDVWYVDNRTLWLDIKILWLTVRKVLVREGISAAGEATMSRFAGGTQTREAIDE
ncbi:lipopolysaccharide/colanic/teichoic acid biosynthesis glycosyltransferase [Variovorax paradoxus]|nr:lipopolysaccharide/colanic/teichoic acid biosynthesis glycosyltransferase [Variovorax paradoxus]